MPTRGLLRVWHLFLSSLSILAPTSLYHQVSARAAQGAGVNSWSLLLEWSAPTARLWPSFPGLPRLTLRFPLSFLTIAKNAYKAAICQVLGRCWAKEHEGNCSGRQDVQGQTHNAKPGLELSLSLVHPQGYVEWLPEATLSFPYHLVSQNFSFVQIFPTSICPNIFPPRVFHLLKTTKWNGSCSIYVCAFPDELFEQPK